MNIIVEFFTRIFSSYYSIIDQYGLQAVEVIDTIRHIVEQDVFEKATAITETSLDDTALLFLRQNLGLVRSLVSGLVDANGCLGVQDKTADEILLCLLKRIGKINNDELKSVVWRNMAREHLLGSVPNMQLTKAGVSGNSDLNEVIERSLRIFKKKKKEAQVKFSPLITFTAGNVQYLLYAVVVLTPPRDLLFDSMGQPLQTAKAREWLYANRQVGWECANGKIVWYIRLNLNLCDTPNARIFALSMQTGGRITRLRYS